MVKAIKPAKDIIHGLDGIVHGYSDLDLGPR